MQPLFSLIIPVYNVERYIVDCAESILRQKFNDCEVIFVDDGSLDSSAIKIADVIATHSLQNWRVLHKPNGGLSSARNFGLTAASGKYVWFVDSDDLLAPGSLWMLKDILDKHTDFDLLLFGYRRFRDESSLEKEYSKDIQLGSYDGAGFLTDIFKRRRESYSWSFVAKRTVYTNNSVTFPEGKNYEDMATTYKLAYFACKVGYIHNIVYLYRDREGSISNTAANRNTRDLFENLTEAETFFASHKSQVYTNDYADFAAYFSLLAYQQTFSRETWRQTKQVFAKLHWQQISIKYRLAFTLASVRLLKVTQWIRKVLTASK